GFYAAELGDVLAQRGRGGGWEEAGGEGALGDLVVAFADAVGAGAAAGGDGGGGVLAFPEEAGVVVEAVAAGHAVVDRLEVGGAALGLVVVVDAETAVEEAEARRLQRLARGLGDAGLEPAHRPGALAREDDAAVPGEAEDRGDVMGLPDREEVHHRAAADVDQILREQVVAQRHRPPAEAKEGDVGGFAGSVVEGAVEARDQVRGVAGGGRQDADPRPLTAALGRQAEDELTDRPVRRPRAELVPAEGQDAADRRRRPRARTVLPTRRGGGHQPAATAVDSASGNGAAGTTPRSPR